MIKLEQSCRSKALAAGLSVLLGTTAFLGTAAHAQETTIELPDINVTATRLTVKRAKPVARRTRATRRARPVRRARPARRAQPSPRDDAGPPAPDAALIADGEGAPGTGTGEGTAQGAVPVTLGITGTSTTVITAEDIAQAPEQTLTGILSREPGVQVSNLFGGVNGARSTVDIRGFGATASSNTLVLIDGRRIDLPDLQGVDWGAIPLNSIQRIEITRGNSGGVLYGDGAVGGVINIVTKTGVNVPTGARVEVAQGSFDQLEGRASITASNGPHALALFGNAIKSGGYRKNNEYEQLNAVGDYRYTQEWGSFYLNASASDQFLGLPADRDVNPWNNVNQLVTDRRGTDQPYDYARQQQTTGTAGVTFNLLPGYELIVDGGFRARDQQSGFFRSCFDSVNNVTKAVCPPIPSFYIESAMVTTSVTPRLRIDSDLFGIPWEGIAGIDSFRTAYEAPRGQYINAPPIHRYNLTQTMLAAYGLTTVTLFSNLDISVGGREQQTRVIASDKLDTKAPGYYGGGCFGSLCFPGDTEAFPLDETQTNKAFHLGFEYRFNPFITLFGRMAQSFRVPNVDERVGSSPYGTPSNFKLKPQRSRDREGGVRLSVGPIWLQWSVYDMYLDDEIFYSPATQTNVNLDPTRRYGSEGIAKLRLSDTLSVKAGIAYTRAVFREGPFGGNDVPLVARNTASVGVVWNIYDNYLVFSGDLRYVSPRRMDGDEANIQPFAPAYTLVDAKLFGEYGRFFWSASIQNLFDEDYFHYALADTFSTPSLGVYYAYPLPGRTYMLRAGLKL